MIKISDESGFSIWINPDAHVIITDDQQKRIGYCLLMVGQVAIAFAKSKDELAEQINKGRDMERQRAWGRAT